MTRTGSSTTTTPRPLELDPPEYGLTKSLKYLQPVTFVTTFLRSGVRRMADQDHELGVGFYLDKQFDMNPNAYGDIESADGLDKLASDLSYFLHQELQEYLGSTSDLGTQEDARLATRDTIERDERVDSIVGAVQLNFDRSSETLRIEVLLDTIIEDGTSELSFDIRRR